MAACQTQVELTAAKPVCQPEDQKQTVAQSKAAYWNKIQQLSVSSTHSKLPTECSKLTGPCHDLDLF